MTMENKPLLQVKDLTVTFGERHNKFTAVKNVSFDIFQGETFGLVGESGSGKTTIARALQEKFGKNTMARFCTMENASAAGSAVKRTGKSPEKYK